MSFETKVHQKLVASEDEIKRNCIAIDLKKFPSGEGGGVPVVSNGNTMWTQEGDSSTIMVASTGSGKTTRIVIPHVISCANAGVSMVITDPKKVIYKTTKSLLDKAGYRTIILDYRNPQYGDRFNSFDVITEKYKAGDEEGAIRMLASFSNTIFESQKNNDDPVWHTGASSYCTGLAQLCFDLFPEEVTFDNIYNLHLQGNEKISGATYLEHYFRVNKGDRSWKSINQVATAPDATKGSYHSVFANGLAPYVLSSSIVDQTKNSTFKVEDIVNEKTAVFIVFPDENSAYDSLITANIDLIFNSLIAIAENTNGCLKRRVCFLLDEFGNLPPLPDIQKKVSLSRARGISWNLVCQSLDQLNVMYGSEISQVIIGNCNNLIYMYSPDIELVKKISKLCGEKDDGTPLYSVDFLRRLNKENGETLFLLERQKAFIGQLPYCSNYCCVKEIDKVDYKMREPQMIEQIDFKTIVEDIRRETIERTMREREKEHEENRKRYDEDKKRRKEEDLNSAISIVDSVICEMIEENNYGS